MDDTVYSSGRVGSNPIEANIINSSQDLYFGALTQGAMLERVSQRVV